MKYPTALL